LPEIDPAASTSDVRLAASIDTTAEPLDSDGRADSSPGQIEAERTDAKALAKKPTHSYPPAAVLDQTFTMRLSSAVIGPA
jgi:hypothetical protein